MPSKSDDPFLVKPVRKYGFPVGVYSGFFFLGLLLFTVGFLGVIMGIYSKLNNETPSMSFGLSLLLTILGIGLATLAYKRYKFIHEDIVQGRIIDLDFDGTKYLIQVRGYSRANKITIQWRKLTYGQFHQFALGDYAEYRSNKWRKHTR